MNLLCRPDEGSQFLRELHFIEARWLLVTMVPIFVVAVPSGTALH